MSFILDIVFVASCAVIFMLGFATGITRSSFAVAAGFVGIMAASYYPYPYGINYYIIFAVMAMLVFFAGLVVRRLVNFFYLNIVDKTAGAVLGVFVWALVCFNVILPSIKNAQDFIEDSRVSLSRFSTMTLNRYLPQFGAFSLRDIRQNILEKVIEIQNNIPETTNEQTETGLS
ncbi:MAG: CvpA family protein [Elusimicrobia bacterium]|nr:CvpA family protein [Elusimicrobiota bacterium]